MLQVQNPYESLMNAMAQYQNNDRQSMSNIQEDPMKKKAPGIQPGQMVNGIAMPKTDPAGTGISWKGKGGVMDSLFGTWKGFGA